MLDCLPRSTGPLTRETVRLRWEGRGGEAPTRPFGLMIDLNGTEAVRGRTIGALADELDDDPPTSLATSDPKVCEPPLQGIALSPREGSSEALLTA